MSLKMVIESLLGAGATQKIINIDLSQAGRLAFSDHKTRSYDPFVR